MSQNDNVSDVFIRGYGQAKYERKPDSSLTTESKLVEAIQLALEQSKLSITDIDGLGVSSFTLAPDRAIDLAVKFGIKATWIMDGGTGGASGIDMAQHAMRSIQARDARNILLVAGDVFHEEDFIDLISNYNKNTQARSSQGITGPNSIFALLTLMQMTKHNLTREDYGLLVCKQRENTKSNTNAAYQNPLLLADYLSAPFVSTPLSIYDCVPVVAGANAIILSADKNSFDKEIKIKKIMALHNSDFHEGDGTVTGLAGLRDEIWKGTNLDINCVDRVSLYDDYPAIVIAQLIDLGLLSGENVSEELRSLLSSGKPTINGSGGQLSAGQCGAGAGLHGFIEIMNSLKSGEIGLVTGYGMVTNRYGSCSNVAILEGV
jgi:hypothetical protein